MANKPTNKVVQRGGDLTLRNAALVAGMGLLLEAVTQLIGSVYFVGRVPQVLSVNAW